jgi:uncharacterized protein (DUF305 family)
MSWSPRTGVRAWLLIALALVVFAGCASPGLTDRDAEFVEAMVPHHRLGLELLELAQPRVEDVRVRRLIFEMGGYHELDLHHLGHGQTRHGSSQDSGEDGRFPGWIDPNRLRDLANLTGTTFDLAWLRIMIEHHEGALRIAEPMLEHGTDSELRGLAETLVAQQKLELSQMRHLIREKSVPDNEAARLLGFPIDC